MTPDEAYHMCGVQLMGSWLLFIYMSHCHELLSFLSPTTNCSSSIASVFALQSIPALYPSRNVFQDRHQRNCQATNLHHLQGLEVDLRAAYTFLCHIIASTTAIISTAPPAKA